MFVIALLSLVKRVEMLGNSTEETFFLLPYPINMSSYIKINNYHPLKAESLYLNKSLHNKPKLNFTINFLNKKQYYFPTDTNSSKMNSIKYKPNELNVTKYDELLLKSLFYPVYNSTVILNKFFQTLQNLFLKDHTIDNRSTTAEDIRSRISQIKPLIKAALKENNEKFQNNVSTNKYLNSKLSLDNNYFPVFNDTERFSKEFKGIEPEVYTHRLPRGETGKTNTDELGSTNEPHTEISDNNSFIHYLDTEDKDFLIPFSEYISKNRSDEITESEMNSINSFIDFKEKLSRMRLGNMNSRKNNIMKFTHPQQYFLYIKAQNIKERFQIVTSKPMHIFYPHQYIIFQEQHHQLPNVEESRIPNEQSPRQPR